jgi:allophanate hydrolase subunit 2
MGMRLVGPKLSHMKGFDIVSDGIPPGSIQVPGSGQPIVLLADRQTTGGYPKIAAVISADLPALGRSRIGTTIGFESVTLSEAHALRRYLLDEMNRIRDRIAPLGPADAGVTAQLHEANLISGAVDAHNCGH